MSDDIVKKFIKMHNINILDTNKRAYVPQKLTANYFVSADDYQARTTSDYRHKTVPLYTIEITEPELTRLATFEASVFNNMHMSHDHHYNMFNDIMEQRANERLLRNQFPAVQKAFEYYSLALSLAKAESR